MVGRPGVDRGRTVAPLWLSDVSRLRRDLRLVRPVRQSGGRAAGVHAGRRLPGVRSGGARLVRRVSAMVAVIRAADASTRAALARHRLPVHLLLLPGGDLSFIHAIATCVRGCWPAVAVPGRNRVPALSEPPSLRPLWRAVSSRVPLVGRPGGLLSRRPFWHRRGHGRDAGERSVAVVVDAWLPLLASSRWRQTRLLHLRRPRLTPTSGLVTRDLAQRASCRI